jgi:PAS domain S-box-containing protein
MEIPEKVELLLVEGSKETSSFIRSVLENMKYTKFKIHHVKTLDEAMKCNKNEIDIVLLDLVLPNSKGIETFRKLYKYCKSCPIVIISKYDDIGCKAVREGAQDFLPCSEIKSSGLLIRSIKYAIERKKLEEEKMKIKNMYEEIVEKTHAAIYEVDFIKDKFTYVNDVICNITGYSEKELLNMSINDVLTETSKEMWLERLELMKKGKKLSDSFEYEIKLKNGSTAWCLITASFKRNSVGKIVGARVIALDITEKKKAQIDSLLKEQMIYEKLEKKLQSWKKQSDVNMLFQKQQLKSIDMKIVSMNNNGIGVI